MSGWGRSSVGRAPALQAGGQEFESLRLHLQRDLHVFAKADTTGTLKTEYRKDLKKKTSKKEKHEPK